MINYLVCDATQPKLAGPKIIVHVCNDIGLWGAGFVLALSKRWPQPEAEYRAWFKNRQSTPLTLGQVQFVEVEPNLWVANLIGQRHIRFENNIPPVRYEAIYHGLEQIAEFAQTKQATIHMPRIACGLAGGDWKKIEVIINETLTANHLEVFVYDLP